MPKTDPVKLDPDEILIAEFNYIAQTAFQANEDRARVASFYFVSVGSLVAAILGTQLFSNSNDLRTIYLAFGGLFTLLTGLGLLTIFQLARLRSAWFRSAEAMNKIKEFYLKNLPETKLEEAIIWRELPPKYIRNSVASLMVIQVAVISAITFCTSIYFWLMAAGLSKYQWLVAIIFLPISYLVQIYLYKKFLK